MLRVAVRPHPLERLFAPRAVAVLAGPGDDPVAGRVLGNLLAGGFEGGLHLVGEGPAAALPGVRRWASLAEVEGPLDLAVVAGPGEGLEAAVRACAARGLGGAVLLPGLPGDDGPGGAAALALRAAAGPGLRLLGPRSSGFLRPQARLDASFTEGGVAAGPLALVTQSGAVGAAALDWAGAHRLGFSAVVTLGQELDVELGDVLEWLSADPATGSILVHLERVRSARGFLSGLRLAARVKPVVVVKAGRHGAEGGPADDAFDAALARTGAVRVASIERMFAAALLLATPRPVTGNRLAILGNARGAGQLAADRAADIGVALPPLAEATRSGLAAAGLPGGAPGNPLDLGPDAGPERYRAAVERCLADPGVDGVLVMLAPRAGTQPDACAAAVVAAGRGQQKPLVACWMGERAVRRARARFAEAGLPELATPEAAVEAFGLLSAHARGQRLLRQIPGPVAPDAEPRIGRAREIIGGALARGRGTLTTAELHRLLGAMGVGERGAAAHRAGGPEWHLAVARDPVLGPVLRLWPGGAAGPAGPPLVALPPLNTAIVRTLLLDSPLAPALTAAGPGAPPLAALERLLWTVSEVVCELPELRELELGPLTVVGGEVYAAGARAALAPPAPGAGRYDHMAIHPWPSDVGDRWVLPDGTAVRVRPIRPEDAEMEASFVRHLSEDTRHLRFMTAMKELTREMLIRFTQLDYARELALVALVERGDTAEEIAVARYAMTDRESAHLALVVADAWQGRGIGSRLLAHLIEVARARGVTRLEGEFLADNAPIRHVLTRLGFGFRRDPDGGDVILMERRLEPLPAAARAPAEARP